MEGVISSAGEVRKIYAKVCVESRRYSGGVEVTLSQSHTIEETEQKEKVYEARR